MGIPGAAEGVGFGGRPDQTGTPPKTSQLALTLKPAPGAVVAPGGMTLISFKKSRKGSLCGFAEVELPLMLIPDIGIHESHGRRWASIPGKPVIDPEGRHKVVDGKRVYVPAFSWRNREIANRFSAAVVALVERHHPEAFATDPEGAP